MTPINWNYLRASGPFAAFKVRDILFCFYRKITTKYTAAETNSQMPYESLVPNNRAGTVRTFPKITSRYEWGMSQSVGGEKS